MLVAIAGRDVSCAPGDLYSCDEASAARMIAAGYAESVRAEVHETAVASAPEQATTRRPRKV